MGRAEKSGEQDTGMTKIYQRGEAEAEKRKGGDAGWIDRKEGGYC